MSEKTGTMTSFSEQLGDMTPLKELAEVLQ